MIKIIIADDHPPLREGIKQELAKDPEIQVVAEAKDGPDLEEVLGTGLAADILLLDFRMPGFKAIEVIPKIQEQCPELKICMVTTYDDERTVRHMLSLGVMGYVVKDEPMHSYPDILREIHLGRPFFSQGITPYLVNTKSTIPDFSEQEEQALTMVAMDYTSEEIAAKMYVTVNSVNTYLKRAAHKLGVKKRAAAVAQAVRLGLIEIP